MIKEAEKRGKKHKVIVAGCLVVVWSWVAFTGWPGHLVVSSLLSLTSRWIESKARVVGCLAVLAKYVAFDW